MEMVSKASPSHKKPTQSEFLNKKMYLKIGNKLINTHLFIFD